VERIDVLRAEEHPISEAFLERRERAVSLVRLLVARGDPPLRIEPPYEVRVALERERTRHLLDAVSLPEPVDAAEGRDPALRADARSGQDEDPAIRVRGGRGHARSLLHGTRFAISRRVVPDDPTPSRESRTPWRGRVP
jgi:hypothetical protein